MRLTGPRWTMSAAAITLALAAGVAPLAAQEAAPAAITAARYAPAALRQDVVRGAYELLDAPELGILFVAAAPSFDEGTSGAVYMLDRDDLHVIRRIQLPRRAFALGMDREAGRLYVGNTLDGSLTVLDAKSGLPLDTIQLGKKLEDEGFEHTRMIEVDQKTGHVFVSSPSETGTVWIVDGRKGELLHRIDDAGLWAAGLAQDAAKGRVYASGGGIEEIAVIDSATGERVDGIATGDTTEAGKEASKHFFVNLAMDPQGGRLFAADAETGQLYVFDAAEGKLLKTVPVGPGTLDVAYNAARDEIYLTWRGVTREAPEGTGGLLVVDGKDYAVKRKLSLPVHPNSLEVSQDGARLYVSIKAPMEEKHPAFRKDAVDSVLRLDLARLAEVK
ncbi:YncE family protein [Paracoccus binzhouensis]|uniref:YncE family protein n=1 Tax=Paracoccus binzhouensis TaxID=2796149 RepID=UPI0018EEFD02|nr:PQQ-binding-like beta-propeller repeat protein [Paracoccus binzhouensis]